MPAHTNSVIMIQMYKDAEGKEQKLEKHYAVAKQDVSEKKKHWTQQAQINKMYGQWKLTLLIMMEKIQSMWVGHLGKMSAVKKCNTTNSPDAAQIHTATYQVGLLQDNLEKEKGTRWLRQG